MDTERLKFSITDIKNANRCPRLFVFNKLYKKKIWPYSGIITGSLVHGTIHKFIKNIKSLQTFRDKFQQPLTYENLLNNIIHIMYELYSELIAKSKDKIGRYQDLETISGSFNYGWNLLQNAAKKIQDILYPVLLKMPIDEAIPKIFLATEWSFKIDTDVNQFPFSLTGRIDWIFHDITQERIYIWDFKTSGKENIHLDFIQIALYAIAIKKEMLIDAKPALVYFTEEKTDILEFDNEKIQEITPIFNSFLLKMRKWFLEEEVPPQTADPSLCIDCILQKECNERFGSISHETLSPEVKKHPLSNKLQDLELVKSTLKNVGLEISQNFKNDKILEKNTGKSEPVKDEIIILGSDTTNNKIFQLPIKNLLRHTAIIGSTGSGKTILGKVIIEEALRLNYSALLIDPQGDLCSIIVPNTPEWESFIQKIKFKIFTPGSDKGIKLSLNPLQPPLPSLLSDHEYLIMLLDNVSSIILMILGYSYKKTSPNEKAILESIINDFWEARKPIDFKTLANVIETSTMIKSLVDGQLVAIDSLISSSKKRELIHNLMKLGTGTEGLFFIGKEHLNIFEFINTNPSLYIINLASVGTDISKRQLVVSWILRQIYDWMLQNPQLSQDKIRFLLYFDEIADFLPPHPNDPPSKKMFSLLLRQARKYGIACIFATQSPGTIDYKALDNVNTLFIGKIPSEQSFKKILDLINPYLSNISLESKNYILSMIRKLEPGNFFVVSSNQNPQLIKVRLLNSKHQTLSLEQIQKLQTLKI